MKKKTLFFTRKTRLGERGRIVLPRIILRSCGLKAGDTLRLMRMPGGDIVLSKVVKVKDPEGLMLKAILQSPRINAGEAWKEVVEERKMSDR